jgi:hypothetical protein
VPDDDIEAELWEIDENLCRAELKPQTGRAAAVIIISASSMAPSWSRTHLPSP